MVSAIGAPLAEILTECNSCCIESDERLGKTLGVMTKRAHELRFIIFQEADQWVGQCLEHDIGAQAEDMDTLLDYLEVAIQAESPLDKIEPAPRYFHELWDRSTKTITPSRPVPDVTLKLCA